MLTSIVETCRFWKKTLSNVTFTPIWCRCWEVQSHWIIQSQDAPKWEPFFILYAICLFFGEGGTILPNLVLFIDMLQQMHLLYNMRKDVVQIIKFIALVYKCGSRLTWTGLWDDIVYLCIFVSACVHMFVYLYVFILQYTTSKH